MSNLIDKETDSTQVPLIIIKTPPTTERTDLKDHVKKLEIGNNNNERVKHVRKTKTSSERQLRNEKKNTGKITKPHIKENEKTTNLALKKQRNIAQKDSDAFYHGALFGSFLGATLSTVVTNLIVKSLEK